MWRHYAHSLITSNSLSLHMEEKRLTSIQLTARTRDRLYWMKFRKTYDVFLNELMDLYEEMKGDQLGYRKEEQRS